MRFRSLLAMLAVLGVALTGPARAGETWIFAAASLKDAMDACARQFSVAHGGHIKTSYASSSVLARQIEAGAPADIFISANEKWMDDVAAKGGIDAASRVDLLGNNLVLIAPRSSKARIAIVPGMDLIKYLGSGRLAMGDPDYVPAGIYGKAALTSLGIWESVKDRLARAENVRAALALVSRGEVPLGIVYGSDAVADHTVRRVAAFPAGSHPPITYPAALVKGSSNAGARAFFDYLKTPAAAAIFQRYGFTVK